MEVEIATGIIAFAGVLRNIAKLGQKFAEAPRVLANLERDCRTTLVVIAHAAIVLRESRRLCASSPTLASADFIRSELTNSITTIHPAISRLLDRLSNTRAPSGYGFKTLTGRIRGFCSLDDIKEAHREVSQDLRTFDRLRDAMRDGWILEILKQVRSGGCQMTDTKPALPALHPVKLSDDERNEGRQALLKFIQDREGKANQRHNHVLIELLLCECNICPNFLDQSGMGIYPIHLAAKNKDSQVIRLLLRYGAKISVHDARGKTPLHLTATLQDDVATAKAILAEDIECAESLVDRANALDDHCRPVLWYASGLGNAPQVFDHLLSLGSAVVDYKCNNPDLPTALWAAAAKNRLEEARALLSVKADPSVRLDDGSTLLHQVTWPGMETLSRDLIAHGASPIARDHKDRQPIHWAAAAGKLDLCLTLLDDAQGVDINSPDHEGTTPLMYAAQTGHFGLVRSLVGKKYRADVSRHDHFGFDAFAAACARGHVKVAAFLLGRDELADRDLDEEDSEGRSALYVAAALGHVEVVEMLVELGASTEGIEPDSVGSIMATGDPNSSRRVNAILKLLGMKPRETDIPESPPTRSLSKLRRNITI